MRIGRNLTVTDIDTYITNYISNYELTEAQIAEIMANTDGAIGCLSELVGIDSKKLPAILLYKELQTIPHNTWTSISWEAAQLDPLAMWNEGEPTEIQTPNSGIYSATFTGSWVANATGRRTCELGGDCKPTLHDLIDCAVVSPHYFTMSGLTFIHYTSPTTVSVYQNSGGNLNLGYIYLLLLRRSIYTYP